MIDPNITLDNHDGPSRKNLPGESGIWILIFGDMAIFALFFGTYLYYRALDVDLYTSSQKDLNAVLGLLNTCVLLTSSWFVVWAVHLVKIQQVRRARFPLAAAIFCGLGFWVIKMIEYSEKFKAGHTIISDGFFMFYFMLTGIHLGHVTIGLVALIFIFNLARKPALTDSEIKMVEGGGVFWHLVDLLWVVLFALLYFV